MQPTPSSAANRDRAMLRPVITTTAGPSPRRHAPRQHRRRRPPLRPRPPAPAAPAMNRIASSISASSSHGDLVHVVAHERERHRPRLDVPAQPVGHVGPASNGAIAPASSAVRNACERRTRPRRPAPGARTRPPTTARARMPARRRPAAPDHGRQRAERWASISRPIVACPAITGCRCTATRRPARPRRAPARAPRPRRRRIRAHERASKRSSAASFAGDALPGTTTVARRPSAVAAHAIPSPWLPADAVTTAASPPGAERRQRARGP